MFWPEEFTAPQTNDWFRCTNTVKLAVSISFYVLVTKYSVLDPPTEKSNNNTNKYEALRLKITFLFNIFETWNTGFERHVKSMTSPPQIYMNVRKRIPRHNFVKLEN